MKENEHTMTLEWLLIEIYLTIIKKTELTKNFDASNDNKQNNSKYKKKKKRTSGNFMAEASYLIYSLSFG